MAQTLKGEPCPGVFEEKRTRLTFFIVFLNKSVRFSAQPLNLPILGDTPMSPGKGPTPLCTPHFLGQGNGRTLVLYFSIGKCHRGVSPAAPRLPKCYKFATFSTLILQLFHTLCAINVVTKHGGVTCFCSGRFFLYGALYFSCL